MNDDVVTTLLTQIADILETYTKILADHKKSFERLFEEVAELNNKVKEIEAVNSLDSSDAEFVASVSARLKAISSTLKDKV